LCEQTLVAVANYRPQTGYVGLQKAVNAP